MTRAAKLEASVHGERRRGAVETRREPGLRTELVELGCHVEQHFEIVRAMAKRVGEREEDALYFFRLALGEVNGVVVGGHCRERFQVQAGAARGTAVHQAGNRVTELAADDDDVPPVTVGDDLVLQVLRGVAAADERFE